MNCENFDFTIWLSSFNWVAGSNEEPLLKLLLLKVSQKSDVLFADSAIGGKGQKFLNNIGIKTNADFVHYVIENSEYSNASLIHTYETWYGRSVYRFEK